MNLDVKPVKVVDGLEFCEGPAFGPDGSLWVVNLQGGYISRVTMDGQAERVVDTPAPNGGQFNADGRYIACECKKKSIIAVTGEGDISVIASECDGQPFNGPNDIAIDADGGMYFTDPDGSSLENRIGSVYYIRPDRSVQRVVGGQAYPNGINITVDRSAVIFAETLTRQIHRAPRKADGSLGQPEVFCQLEGGVGPDGMCFDQDGNLYIAHFGSSCVDVLDPAGEIIGKLETPGENPTNCCFGPPGSQYQSSLFVTETVTDAVWRYDVGVAGMPLHHLAVASD